MAVKKIQVGNAKAKEEFENEVKLISNVHHRNLLRLLGWSSEGSNLLLVLEYMPNGSLDRFLWGQLRSYTSSMIVIKIEIDGNTNICLDI